MSRIHEALQKAEQERKSAQKLDTSAAELSLSLPDIPVPEIPLIPHVPAVGSVAAAAQPQLLPAKPDGLFAAARRMAWSPDKEAMLFFDSSKHYEVGMEEFRTLRSRLFQIREKRQLKVVLVGSALPGEGKSFVAANLAQVIARQHGRRVLLIDTDLRCASLHEYLGTDPNPGMTDYLLGAAGESEIVQRGSMDGLFFIPRGKEVGNPAELIANGRCKALLENMAPHFDWIVLDSPPAVPVADATLLAEHCDGVLLVVRAGSTPVEEAQRAAREFRNRNLVGVVLNQAMPASGYNSYYHKRYGGYGHAPATGDKRD